MAWIKMRVDLRTHPKVVRMASALRADRLRVIGGLWAVWSIFDAHSSDGVLEGYSFSVIDEELGWKGFAKAMSDIEWLIEIDGGGLEAPRFEEHNGQSAKRRAMETERKRSDREADKAGTESGQTSASDADKKRTREEKRREEVNIPPLADAPKVQLSKKAKLSPMPNGFEDFKNLSPRFRTWMSEKRLGERYVAIQLETFVSYARRKDAKYADWDEALMAACRENWAKVPASVAPMAGVI